MLDASPNKKFLWFPLFRLQQAASSDHGYRLLEELCYDFGHRIAGSHTLEQAVDWAERKMKADGLEASFF